MGATSIVLAVAMFAGAGSPGCMPEHSFDFFNFEKVLPLGYDDSVVVRAPACLGATVGGAAGLVVGLVAFVPVGVVESTAHRVSGGGGDEMPATKAVFWGPLAIGAVGGHYVLGGPVYVAKLVVWDGPVALVTKGPGAVWRGVRDAAKGAGKTVRKWWEWYGP